VVADAEHLNGRPVTGTDLGRMIGDMTEGRITRRVR
jgi:hypothetical protein